MNSLSYVQCENTSKQSITFFFNNLSLTTNKVFCIRMINSKQCLILFSDGFTSPGPGHLERIKCREF